MTDQTEQTAAPVAESEEESAALKNWKAKRELLSDIDVRRTLDALGARGNQDGDRNKYKIDGVGNILVKRNAQSWLNGNTGQSGYGSVSLVRHALDFAKDSEAMNWLVEQFPEVLQGDWRQRAAEKGDRPDEPQELSSFQPPERVDSALDDVRAYLTIQRGLPPSLINREIEEGRLYATIKRVFDEGSQSYADDPRCVFVGPSSAEIRSVSPSGFKGASDGSDSENSGYQVMFRHAAAHEPVVSLCEAAIDALSYHALHPNRFTLSTNGAGRFSLQYRITLECWRNGFGTDHAYDADHAGDLAAQRVFNALFLRDRLAQEWETTPERVDDLIVQNKIVAVPSESPHEMFLSHKDKPEHPVHESKRVTREDKTVVMETVDTGTTAPATITVKIAKAIGSIKRGVLTFTLTPAEINAVQASYRTQRSRPKGAKDWNDVWKRQGPEAVAAYERAHVGPPSPVPAAAEVRPEPTAAVSPPAAPSTAGYTGRWRPR